MQSRLENSIEAAVDYYAVMHNFLPRKLNNAANDGWPDKLYVSHIGQHFYIEFKRAGEEPRVLQYYRMMSLLDRNCDVYIVDNVEDGKYVIDFYRGTVETPPVSRASYQHCSEAIRRGLASRSRTGKDKLLSSGVQDTES